jgi:hypothetical protein
MSCILLHVLESLILFERTSLPKLLVAAEGERYLPTPKTVYTPDCCFHPNRDRDRVPLKHLQQALTEREIHTL